VIRSRAKWIPRANALALLGVLAVPLDDVSQWKHQKFRNTGEHQVAATDCGLRIKVEKSAGPLVLRLPAVQAVRGFRLEAEFHGLPRLRAGIPEGEGKNDDFPLRIGLVVPGAYRLAGLRKLLAPAWIKELMIDLPPGSGLDRVEFFNLIQSPELLGKARTHPHSSLLKENFFAQVRASGMQEYRHSWDGPIATTAIWINIDGDDTQSTYVVCLKRLELQLDP